MIKGKEWIPVQNVTKYKIREQQISSTSSCNTRGHVMKLAGGERSIFFTHCTVKMQFIYIYI